MISSMALMRDEQTPVEHRRLRSSVGALAAVYVAQSHSDHDGGDDDGPHDL